MGSLGFISGLVLFQLALNYINWWYQSQSGVMIFIPKLIKRPEQLAFLKEDGLALLAVIGRGKGWIYWWGARGGGGSSPPTNVDPMEMPRAPLRIFDMVALRRRGWAFILDPSLGTVDAGCCTRHSSFLVSRGGRAALHRRQEDQEAWRWCTKQQLEWRGELAAGQEVAAGPVRDPNGGTSVTTTCCNWWRMCRSRKWYIFMFYLFYIKLKYHSIYDDHESVS